MILHEKNNLIRNTMMRERESRHTRTPVPQEPQVCKTKLLESRGKRFLLIKHEVRVGGNRSVLTSSTSLASKSAENYITVVRTRSIAVAVLFRDQILLSSSKKALITVEHEAPHF